MSKPSYRKWRSRPGTALPLFSRFAAVLTQNQTFALHYADLGVRNALVGLGHDPAPVVAAGAILSLPHFTA